MVISCPNCNTSYNLPDNVAKAGSKLRCKVCAQVFALVESSEGLTGAIIERPQTIPQPQPAPRQPDQAFTQPPAPSAAPISPQASSQPPQAAAPVPGEAPREVGSSNLRINLGDKPKKSGKTPLIVLLILVLLGVGGYLAWTKTSLLDPVKAPIAGLLAPLQNKMSGLFAGSEKPEEQGGNEMAELVRDLGLRNLRQYYIVNDKIGDIMVVEGLVANESNEAREMIRLEVQLYGDNGQLLLSKSQLAGTQVSNFQLQVLGMEELEQALNNRLDQLTNNTNIQPGESVPFMIVVYNPPQEARDFGIRIIEARRPTPTEEESTN